MNEKEENTIKEWEIVIGERPHILELLSPPYKEIATALFQNQTNNSIK